MKTFDNTLLNNNTINPENDRPVPMSKVKPEPEPDDEKVQWTDDSEVDLEQLKKKRATKSKSRPTKKQKYHDARKKDHTLTTLKIEPGVGVKCVKSYAEDTKDKPEEITTANVPQKIRERRCEFEDKRAKLQDAGLCLPPDYSGIYFSDSEDLATLRQKPVFDNVSGVTPSRPYSDIELEESAGLIPAAIAQYLRDYQVDGVRFLHRLFVYQRGGILGDDMGLGKTVQVAAFLTVAYGKTGDERDAKRMRKMRRQDSNWYPLTLIICPGSLIVNWKNELNRWGWWTVDLFHGANKDDVLGSARAGRLEIMITTYDTYKNSRDAINTVQWDVVIADECHRLKDPTAEITKAMNHVNALCRIGLTGTAIQNKYEELWTLLNWTNPGRFGHLKEWNRTISKPLRLGQSHDATLIQLKIARQTARKLVENLLPEFFIRRVKSLIADQLPKKSDRVVFCPLTDVQKQAYETFLKSDDMQLLQQISDPCSCGRGGNKGWCCFKTLADGRSWLKIVFPSMQLLQKLSNHVALLIPAVSDLPEKQEAGLETLKQCFPKTWKYLYDNRDSMINLANPEFCGKWKILRKLLRFWHEKGDKVLIFSHSVRLLRTLQHLFSNTSYNVSYLDGSLSYEDRQRVVDDYNTDPDQFVFLISTKAGGVGLNITSANKVVIIDPHWNPSYDLQAQDRAYRIGQTRDVDVFRLISVGTIEEIVYARQIYKQQQANIGYTASSERRYFKGVQEDSDRQGEIFGLRNLFAFHGDRAILRDIVNKTNIAEAKAGVNLADVDMKSMEADSERDTAESSSTGVVKQEDDHGIGRIAAQVTAESGGGNDKKPSDETTSHRDAVQAILTSAGVQYTHENSEVIGTSRVEQHLSRRAEMLSQTQDDEAETEDEEEYDYGPPYAANRNRFGRFDGGSSSGSHAALRRLESQTYLTATAELAATAAGSPHQVRYQYNPPRDVMQRQFCSLARELGYASATEFAVAVESWSQEQRRDCLHAFYQRREESLKSAQEGEERVKSEPGGVAVKSEPPVDDKSLVEKEEEQVKHEADEKIAIHDMKSSGETLFLSDDDDDDDEL